MSDTLGRITVPDLVVSGVFPAIIDWGASYQHEIPVVTHQIGNASAGLKIEQCFKLGAGARVFTVRCSAMTTAERNALRDFWEARKGAHDGFTLNWPNDDGSGTTAYTVTFENGALTFDQVTDAISSVGLNLIEVKTSGFPTYSVSVTQTRFPAGALATGLLSRVQELIPLVRIRVKEAAVPDVYVSDRRCTVAGQLYQARLTGWDGITQDLGGAADAASFSLGNADRVMTALANDTNLDHAIVSFSIYHVGTGIRLDLWQGEVVDWSGATEPTFTIEAGDPVYELTLQYPLRKPCRTCHKPYGNSAAGCLGLKGNASGLDLVHFPNADSNTCDHGYDTPNGCMAHSGSACPTTMRGFGGLFPKEQAAYIKFTGSSGGVHLTSTSQVSESIFSADAVIPEVYTGAPMPVPCLVAAGREENDYYEALGIVCEGPAVLSSDFTKHTLDGQTAHGPAPLGLRLYSGTDPAGETDFFSLDQSGNQTGGDWKKVYSGNSTYNRIFAGGTAFAVIRRSDAKGLQLSKLAEHQMSITVQSGLGGWVWNGTPARQWTNTLTNPVWLAVNVFLRGRGLWHASAAAQEAVFDVQAALSAAAICNTTVTKLVGTGTEMQFEFYGQIRDQKSLREWLQQILNNCLGYFAFSNGKLKIGIRVNSSVVEAYTTGNTIFGSVDITPRRPAYNRLTGNFANQDLQFQADSLPVEDLDHAQMLAGGSGTAQFLKGQIDLCGVSTRSRAARIVATTLREELGGINADEWKDARNVVFKTTILGLHSEVGQVDSLDDSGMPDGHGEFRVTRWRLNGDWSVELAGRTTTDSMYNLAIGPKPADVQPDALPDELVMDLIPGDVQPIGGQPFLITQTSDGLNSTLLIEYDPPNPIGVFAGLIAHPDPEDDGKISQPWTFEYNGDPTAPAGNAARHGTAKVVIAQNTSADQHGYLYLTPRSRTYRKPLSLRTAALPSPYRAITIPQTGGLGDPGPAPAVQSATAETFPEYNEAHGWYWGVRGAVVEPADVSNYSGYSVYIRGIVRGSSPETYESGPRWLNRIPRGTTNWDITAKWALPPRWDQYFDITYRPHNIKGIENTDPATWTTVRVRLQSVTTGSNGDGPPGLEYCDAVTLDPSKFHVAIENRPDLGWAFQFYADANAIVAPADLKFRLFDVHFRYPDGNDARFNTGMKPASGPMRSPWYAWPSHEGNDFYLTVYVLSVDSADGANTYVNGVTPSVSLHMVRPVPTNGQEFAPFATNFQASISYPATADGVSSFQVNCNANTPLTAHVGGLRFLYRETDATFAEIATNPWKLVGPDAKLKGADTPATVAYTLRTASNPAPGFSAAKYFRAFALTIDRNGNVNTVDWANTPHADLTYSVQTGGLKLDRSDPNTVGGGMQVTGGKLNWRPGDGLQIGADGKATINYGPGLAFSLGQLLVNVQSGGGVGMNGNQLYVPLGAIDPTKLASGCLGDLSKYPSDKRPLIIVYGTPALPNTNYPTGAVIFNTYDGKIYRNVNGAWQKGTDPQDIITGTLASGVVYAGRVAAAQIDAGTINVGSGGLTFSGSGGILISNGGNILVSPGTISASTGYFTTAGSGWTITGGYSPTISAVTGGGQSSIDAHVHKVGGTTVIDSTRRLQNVTHNSVIVGSTTVIDAASNIGNRTSAHLIPKDSGGLPTAASMSPGELVAWFDSASGKAKLAFRPGSGGTVYVFTSA